MTFFIIRINNIFPANIFIYIGLKWFSGILEWNWYLFLVFVLL